MFITTLKLACQLQHVVATQQYLHGKCSFNVYVPSPDLDKMTLGFSKILLPHRTGGLETPRSSARRARSLPLPPPRFLSTRAVGFHRSLGGHRDRRVPRGAPGAPPRPQAGTRRRRERLRDRGRWRSVPAQPGPARRSSGLVLRGDDGLVSGDGGASRERDGVRGELVGPVATDVGPDARVLGEAGGVRGAGGFQGWARSVRGAYLSGREFCGPCPVLEGRRRRAAAIDI